jgi:uncharacterized protein
MSMNKQKINYSIRKMIYSDIKSIAASFAHRNKTIEQYESYFAEHQQGDRVLLVFSLQLYWNIKSLLIPMALRDLIFSKRDEILALAAQYDAVNVRLFGSVARESERPDSDVDFLVDVQRQWSLFDHIGLIQDLEDLLGRKVDLIPADRIREFCRDRILSEAIPL